MSSENTQKAFGASAPPRKKSGGSVTQLRTRTAGFAGAASLDEAARQFSVDQLIHHANTKWDAGRGALQLRLAASAQRARGCLSLHIAHEQRRPQLPRAARVEIKIHGRVGPRVPHDRLPSGWVAMDERGDVVYTAVRYEPAVVDALVPRHLLSSEILPAVACPALDSPADVSATRPGLGPVTAASASRPRLEGAREPTSDTTTSAAAEAAAAASPARSLTAEPIETSELSFAAPVSSAQRSNTGDGRCLALWQATAPLHTAAPPFLASLALRRSASRAAASASEGAALQSERSFAAAALSAVEAMTESTNGAMGEESEHACNRLGAALAGDGASEIEATAHVLGEAAGAVSVMCRSEKWLVLKGNDDMGPSSAVCRSEHISPRKWRESSVDKLKANRGGQIMHCGVQVEKVVAWWPT
eukprot:CAMPEP_0119352642 /NCGR_PEP_ID=MMETSP1334-20130426/1910_1 /TAXON_ID=127549 /ORGANISM="Calcidiscus leptoporus, Strain RCC1130" /LENGTH=417 /DNA_ID=CAMNT_0007365735 /DNA_START=120 /DNA_END=1370 /DNA_ORIENTATION=-